MRQDNLLALRRDAFAGITNSNQKPQPGQDPRRVAIRKAIDQRWIVDITCIEKETRPYYLVVVLDAVSRGIIGWALDRTVEDAAGRAALRSALLQQPDATPGASFQPPNPLLGPQRRLAPTAQD